MIDNLLGITRYGELKRLSPRGPQGWEDWYDTGTLRRLYHYSDIGVIKAINEGKSGDINGQRFILQLQTHPATANAVTNS